MAKTVHGVGPGGANADITEEPYKGPSAAVAAAGEGSIAHFGLGAIGLVIGFVFAYFNHIKLGNFIDARRARGLELIKNAPNNKHWWGEALLSMFGHGKNAMADIKVVGGEVWRNELAVREVSKMENGWLFTLSDDIRKIPGIKQALGLLGSGKNAEAAEKQINTAIMGGGIMGAFGFFIAPIAFWITGIKHANEGRDQFRRAKDEIHTTRKQYDSLREKYVETATELEHHRASKGAVAMTPQEDVPARNAGNEDPKRQDITRPGAVVTSVSREAAYAPQPAHTVTT